MLNGFVSAIPVEDRPTGTNNRWQRIGVGRFIAQLFATNGVYQTGDLVTQETEPDSDLYQAWILTGANQNGLTTPITAANSPGGTANQWEPVPTIEELNNIVARLENCLLYTSPSPRDS